MLPEAANDAILSLLVASGLGGSEVAVQFCQQGGNNRVFLIESGGRRVIAKRYYRSASDTRDRLKAEWTFLSYAHGLGLACVPQPILRDERTGIALYEFIDGRKLEPTEIDHAAVAAGAQFFLALNGPNRQLLAAGLPAASEACFSLADHLAMVDRRFKRLAGVEAASDVDAEAVEIIAALRARWQRIRGGVEQMAARNGWPLAQRLSPEQRCISPSDFGFHNALLRPSGEICFIDFEYAGWDDPAKMAADFFSQPAIPVPPAHLDCFLETVAGFSADSETMRTRTQLLLPVFRTKWCCIMLNDFLPDSSRRRQFADPETDVTVRKRGQLAKATKAMQSLEC